MFYGPFTVINLNDEANLSNQSSYSEAKAFIGYAKGQHPQCLHLLFPYRFD